MKDSQKARLPINVELCIKVRQGKVVKETMLRTGTPSDYDAYSATRQVQHELGGPLYDLIKQVTEEYQII